MKTINVDDLCNEVMADMPTFYRMVELLKTPKIGDKAADIILNASLKDPIMLMAAISYKEGTIVDMVQAAMAFGMTLGRLYGRSELMQELQEVKSDRTSI